MHQNSEKYYIATQAPKPETIDAFWRMVWEQRVAIIVKLTNLEEHGRVKVFKFYCLILFLIPLKLISYYDRYYLLD